MYEKHINFIAFQFLVLNLHLVMCTQSYNKHNKSTSAHHLLFDLSQLEYYTL